jgi:hypothetical protein
MVYNQRFGITCLSHLLKMGQASVPETLVIHQKLTPVYNPKTFKEHYDHGGSLQLHSYVIVYKWLSLMACSVKGSHHILLFEAIIFQHHISTR